MKVILAQSSSGDWEGLYIDGHLTNEGHSISAYHALLAVVKEGKLLTEVYEWELDQEWVEDYGLPINSSDIPGEVVMRRKRIVA